MAEKYIVIELQKNGDTVSNVVTSHDTLSDAQYKFHYTAAFAAISEVEKHSIVLLDDNGFTVDRVAFEHSV